MATQFVELKAGHVIRDTRGRPGFRSEWEGRSYGRTSRLARNASTELSAQNGPSGVSSGNREVEFSENADSAGCARWVRLGWREPGASIDGGPERLRKRWRVAGELQNLSLAGQTPFTALIGAVVVCTQNESTPQHYKCCGVYKWSGAGSNRRHQDFQSCALPTELPDRSSSSQSLAGSRRILLCRDAGKSTGGRNLRPLMGRRPVIRLLQVVFLDLAVQRPFADAQHLGRLFPPTAGQFEGP